jgi:hypothetical protein
VPAGRGRRFDPWFAILALLALAGLAALAPAIVPTDLNLTYPFMDGDSHDWIANGLRLAGEDVRYSGRPPLLPLWIALLHRLSALSCLPLLLQGLFRATALAFYSLAARLHPRRAAFAAAAALLLNSSLQELSLQVMADVPASCLLLLAARSFLLAGGETEAGRRRRRYLASGLWAGLSALTQAAGVLWVPAAGATALLHRRRELRSPWLWAALLPPLVLPLLWGAVRPPAFGGSGGVAREQWLLLSFHTGSVPFYLYALGSLLGLPGALLLAAGLAAAGRSLRRDEARFLAAALLLALTVFFVFLYDYDAKRFLAWGVWFEGLFVAEALSRLRSRTAFAAAAGLLLAVSALPLPTPGNDASMLAVWPAPPVYLRAPAGATATGSAVLEPAAARLVRAPLTAWIEHGPLPRAWEARRRGAIPDPARFATARSALFLYEQPLDGGGRYRTLTRLGNALRKRVKFVPASCFAAYWPLIRLAPLGTLAGEYALYRARLPGLPDTWLVAVSAGGPLHRRLDELAAHPPGPARFGPARLARGRREAAAMKRYVAGSDGFVALVPSRRPADLSQLYLPFLLETTELYVAEPGREREMLDLLAGAPTLARRSFGTAAVRKTAYRGRKTAVVTYHPGGYRGALTGTAAPRRPPPPARRPRRRSPPARPAAAPPAGGSAPAAAP